MLRAMIQLAPESAEDPVAKLRALAETPPSGEVAYTLERTAEGQIVATAVEVTDERRVRFAFIKPSGSQGGQLGPVIKRSFNAQKEVSPGAKVLTTTLKDFERIASGAGELAAVYRTALDVLGEGTPDVRCARWQEALAAIPGKKAAYVSLGPAPGDNPVFAKHLLGKLQATRYKLEDTAVGVCPLCDEEAPLAANGLKGAAINFTNLDNPGKFPGLTKDHADRRFAICGDCADALRRFKLTVAPELKCFIAGESALLIPHVVGSGDSRAHRRARDVVERARAGDGTHADEERLLRSLEKEGSLAAFHVLWAVVGQDLDDVTGLITDVPRTRLAELSAVNLVANGWRGGVLPKLPLRDTVFDLRLSLFGAVLRSPNRHAAPNDSLRRELARAVYTATPTSARTLFRALRLIAVDHLARCLTLEPRLCLWSLLTEGFSGKDDKREPNLASWIRHAALAVRYLQHLEVLEPMSDTLFTPKSPRLRPFFEHSGIAGEARAFAFLLGVLYGKLLTVQAARRVNVQSNALTWLRRGTLSGRDLPGLFVRVQGKFLEYGTRSPEIGEVVSELAPLGRLLGDRFDLDSDTTMYFLLLGQASAAEILPSKTETP